MFLDKIPDNIFKRLKDQFQSFQKHDLVEAMKIACPEEPADNEWEFEWIQNNIEDHKSLNLLQFFPPVRRT